METLLDEINLNEGVVGSVIMGKGIAEQMGNLPSVFRPEKLCAFADHVRRFTILGEGNGGFHGMEFCYNHATVVARCVSKKFLLLTFCLPETDVQQIHLQHNVLLPELKDILAKKPIIAVSDAPLPIPAPSMSNLQDADDRPDHLPSTVMDKKAASTAKVEPLPDQASEKKVVKKRSMVFRGAVYEE